MKKIIIGLIFILCAISSQAQVDTISQNAYQSNVFQIVNFRGGVTGNYSVMIPVIDTLNNYATTIRGALTVRPQDNVLYKSNGVFWEAMLSNSTGYIIDTVNVKFPLGVYYDSSGRQTIYTRFNGLFDGGIVSWSGSGLIFDVTTAYYGINYLPYSSPTMQVTLTTSPVTQRRTDLFIVDTFNLADKITGDSAANPVIPQFNSSSQLGLTSITLNAGDTVPSSISLNLIYNEDLQTPTEWDTSRNGTINVDFENTDNPYIGSKAIFVSSYQNGGQIIFTDGQQDTLRNGDLLKTYLYLNNPLTNRFQWQFFNNNTAVSNKFSLQSGFGLNPLDTGEYQPVVIPLNAFTFSSNYYNKIKITMAGNDTSGAGGYYLDYIQIQSGIYNPNTDFSNKVDSVVMRNINGVYTGTSADTAMYYDVKGQIHFISFIGSGGGGSGTVTSVGLTSSDITVGGTASPITSSGTFTLTLPNINGNVGTFTNVTLTANAKGQITAVSSGSVTSGTVTNVTGTAPVIITGTSTITPNVTVDTGRNVGQLATGGSLNKVRDSLQANINLKVNISDTGNMLANYLIRSNITAGTNITITGSGTTVAPYVVNSSGGGGGIDSIRKAANSDSIKQYSSGTGTFAVRTQRVFNVKDREYGAKGDSTTDDTQAIQAAIDACFAANIAGGGTVYFPNGIYQISGALVTSGGTNAQLVIPSEVYSDQRAKHITFMGETKPVSFPPALYIDAPYSRQGVILRSTITGSGSVPAVFGSDAGGFTSHTVSFENITLLVEANAGATGPTMTGINGTWFSSLSVNNCMVGIDTSEYKDTIPQNQVAGIITTKVAGQSMSSVRNTLVYGFRYGIVAGEHAYLENAQVFNCYASFVISPNSHPVYATKILSQWSVIDLLIPNSTIMGQTPGNCGVDITEMEVEKFDNLPRWFNNVTTVADSGNRATGQIIYNVNAQNGGEGTFVKYNATGIRTIPLRNTGIIPTPIYVSTNHLTTTAVQIKKGDGTGAVDKIIAVNDASFKNVGTAGDIAIFNPVAGSSIKMAAGNFGTPHVLIDSIGRFNVATDTLSNSTVASFFMPLMTTNQKAQMWLGKSYSSGFYWAYNNVATPNLSLQHAAVLPGTGSFTINSSGNVGVGTVTPVAKFSVVGNMVDSGDITAYGSIVATGSTGVFSATGTGQDLVYIVGSNASRAGLRAQTTNSAAQTTFYFENNRGSFASYGGLLYGGSTNAQGNLFGVSRADKLLFFADGASNLGMYIGTLGAQPFVIGTNNTAEITVASGGATTIRNLTGTGTRPVVASSTGVLSTSAVGQIVGTATNDAATAGNVGQEIVSTISTYTNYSTTATYQNVTSIALTAGDWDVSAFMTYSSNGATITAASDAIFVISTTTASAAGATEGVNIAYIPQAALLGTSHFSESISPFRVSLSGSTTYYLNTQATFTLGNPQYVGTIRARRLR